MSNASVQAIGLGLSGKVFVTKMPWASLRPMSTFNADACCLQECLGSQRMPHECEVARSPGAAY